MEHPIQEGTPRGVLVRDFLIFQFKTALDGLKDALVLPLATFVVVIDLVFGREDTRGKTFYSLLAACESFDRWLNLYSPAQQAAGSRDGLFTGSAPGDGSMVGDLEEMMRPQEPAARPAGHLHG